MRHGRADAARRGEKQNDKAGRGTSNAIACWLKPFRKGAVAVDARMNTLDINRSIHLTFKAAVKRFLCALPHEAVKFSILAS